MIPEVPRRSVPPSSYKLEEEKIQCLRNSANADMTVPITIPLLVIVSLQSLSRIAHVADTVSESELRMPDLTFAEWLFAIYLLGILPAWIILTRIGMKYNWQDMNDDTEGRVMLLVITFCMSWMWPLAIPGFWVWELTFGRAK